MNANANLRRLSNLFRFITILIMLLTNVSGAIPVRRVYAQSASYILRDDDAGGDCGLLGTWDLLSKTCLLTADVDGIIQIQSNNIILDGNQHVLNGPGRDYGSQAVLVFGSGVSIRNLTIRNAYYGVWFYSSSQSSLFNNTLTENDYGLHLMYAPDNQIYGNHFSNNTRAAINLTYDSHRNRIADNIMTENGTGIFIQWGTENEISGNTISDGYTGIALSKTSRNTITENTLRNNQVGISLAESGDNTVVSNDTDQQLYYGIAVESSNDNMISNNMIGDSGIFIAYESARNTFRENTLIGRHVHIENSPGNYFYNNNFLGAGVDAYGGDSIFNMDAPIGGNYWSEYDSSMEGCFDLNMDGFCDAPYLLPVGQDNLPWTRQDHSINQPPIAEAGESYSGFTTEPIFLDASASADPDGDNLTYEWDLNNDGAYDATGVTTPVTFDLAGEYTVGLRVTDPLGLTSTDTITIAVTTNPNLGIIHAYPETDFVDFQGCLSGRTYILTIDDPSNGSGVDYSDARYATPPDWDPSACYVAFPLASFDLAAGQIVTITDGSSSRTLVVTPPGSITLDAPTDRASGTMRPGSFVDVYIDGIRRYATADSTGAWSVDFSVPGDPNSETVDIVPGTQGTLFEWDEDADRTGYFWRVLRPHFVVWVADDDICGWQWPQGATVTLSVDTPGTPATPDYTASQTVPTHNWDVNSACLGFSLNGQFDIQAGDTVTLTDGVTVRTHVVTELNLGGVDPATDTVFGTAPVGSHIQVLASSPNGWINRWETTDASGNWRADFSVAGDTPEEQATIDLVPGSSGEVKQVEDEQGNTTQFHWNVINPNFSVRLRENQVHGYGWPLGTNVTLIVDGNEISTQTVTPTDWDPNQTFVWFDLGESLTLQAGQLIELTNGIITKSHLVTDLVVDGVDPQQDTVFGTTSPGTQVDIGHIYCNENGCFGYRRELADSNGAWLADFSVTGEDGDEQDIIDLTLGMGSEARQCDQDGDCTQVGWWIANPGIVAFPIQDSLGGDDWPRDLPVIMTIDDPGNGPGVDFTNTQLPGDRPWAPNGTWIEFDLQGFDLKPGALVTYDNGQTTKTHSVIDLRVTSVDVESDTLSGTAAPGGEVHGWVETPSGNANRHTVADGNGNWSLVFSTPGTNGGEQDIVDITRGTTGQVTAFDTDWDKTQIEWRAPDPRIFALLGEQRVHAWGWTAGTLLTLTIDNPATLQSPDYTGTQVATAFEDWDHGAEWGIVYNIQPGYLVTVSGGGITKELAVAPLTVTLVDIDADTVSGTGDPGFEIHVGLLCDENSCTRRNIYVDSDGNWFADFSVRGLDEDETVFDIRPGSGTGVYQIDEDGDATNVGWEVPNPTVMVRANENRVEGQGWTLGSTVTVTVDDPINGLTPDISKTAVVYEASWNPGEYRFDIDLRNEYDIKPGDIVTASDGTITKTHTTTSLIFTEINIDTDTVTGSAEAGSPVDVWTCDNFGCYNIPTVFADANGVWVADFTGTSDIVRGTWVDSSQADDDGDGTFYGENVPNPTIGVRANSDNVEGWHWPLGATVTVTVDDPATPAEPDITRTTVAFQAPSNPDEIRIDLNLNGVIDIQPGFVVTASYDDILKTHTVTTLTFTEINIDNNTVTGSAEAGSPVDVWTCDNFGCYNIPTVFADENGVWVANFTGTYDIVGGTWVDASQNDNDGDSTYYGRTVPNPNFSVQLTDNEVHGFEWALGTAVTLTVDDPDTPQPVDYTDSQTVIVANWDPNQTVVRFRLSDNNFTLESGMTVTMSDGSTTKTHEITDLVVTAVDPALDTVSGSAQPGSQVDIGHIFCDENGCYGYRRVNADENGSWTADFAHPGEDDDEQDIVDLAFGMRNEARQCDEDGDCTTKYWNITWVAPDTVPLVVGIGSDHDLSLPWTDIDTLTILNQLLEPPFRLMEDGTLMFAAATQYSASADGMVYTITFRDMTWSDGVPVTAQHYADGLLRLLDPASGYDYPSLYYPIAGAKDYNMGLTNDPNDVGIRALDAHTLQITLESPVAYFKELLAYPAFLPVRLDLLAQYGEAWLSPENFVGNGPYRLIEHDAGHFLLEQNPYYYDPDQVQFSQIGFAVIPDDHERLDAYRRGDIDMLWTFPRYEYQNIINDPVLSQEIDISIQPGIQYLGLNVDRYPTDNAFVRMALASAIDRQYLIDSVIGADWRTEATSVIPPTLFGYQGGAVGYGYDETQARNYLAQAGFPGGINFPEIVLVSNTGHEVIVEYIAQQWREVLGIPVRVEYYEWNEYLDMLRNCRADPAACDYNVYRLGWIVDYTDPNNILADLFSPDSANQFTGWDDTRYRELLQLSLVELDPVQRLEYIREAERILVQDDATVLPLYYTDRLSLIKPGIEPSFGPLIAHFNLWRPANEPPVADAGPDQTVYAHDLVLLNASASYDPDADPLTYAWDLDNDGGYDDGSGVTITTTFSEPGTYDVGLSVTDAGLSSTDTVTITVLPWDLSGFYQPVDMNGVYNLVKGGSTVPLKFEIFAGSTELTDTTAVRNLGYAQTSCNANATIDAIETLAMGNTALRYDVTSGQFIYNWKTPNMPGTCFRITITTTDGSSLLAYFKLK